MVVMLLLSAAWKQRLRKSARWPELAGLMNLWQSAS
jgi:hypothetical protein